VTAGHSPLTAAEIIAKGGWHPGYARVIALASHDGYGFALVDGNGDGSELEAETWAWRDGAWHGLGSSGAGRLDRVGPIRTAGQIGESASFAYGSAPARTMSRSRSTAKSTPCPSGSTACGRSSPSTQAAPTGTPPSWRIDKSARYARQRKHHTKLPDPRRTAVILSSFRISLAIRGFYICDMSLT